MFPEVAQTTVRLLHRLGLTVVVPRTQTRCGQMHINVGYERQVLPLIRYRVRSLDAVVVPSASCVGSIRHQQVIVASVSSHLENPCSVCLEF